MKARQNLRKRMRHAGQRGAYDPLRASYGPEWERLRERTGAAPLRTATSEARASAPPPPVIYEFQVVRKLSMSTIYGKFAMRESDGEE